MASEDSINKQPPEPPVLAISQTESKVEKKDGEDEAEAGNSKIKPEDDLQTLNSLSDFKEDVFVSCPYNKAHQILISRMQTHLTKCRESFKNARKRVCPYNVAHMINEMEWNLHCELCPDRTLNDGAQKTVEEEAEEANDSRALVPVENRDVIMAPLENWDEEESPTYDPNVKLETVGTILVQPRGGKKYEREQFRAQRRRLYHQTVHNSNALETISECGMERFEPDDLVGACSIPRYAKEGKMANSSSIARSANACKPHWENRKFVPQNDNRQEHFKDDYDDCKSNSSKNHAMLSPNKKGGSGDWRQKHSSRSSLTDSEPDYRFKEERSSYGFNEKYTQNKDWGYDDNPSGKFMYKKEDQSKEKCAANKGFQDRNFNMRSKNYSKENNRGREEKEEHIMDGNGNWVLCGKKGRQMEDKPPTYKISDKPKRVSHENENWGDLYTPVVTKESRFHTQDSPPYSPSPMTVDTDVHDYGHFQEVQSKNRFPGSVEMASMQTKQNFSYETNNTELQRNYSAEFRQKMSTTNYKPLMTSHSHSATPSVVTPVDKMKDTASHAWLQVGNSVKFRPHSVNLHAVNLTPPPETSCHPLQTTTHSAFHKYNKQYEPEVYDEPVAKKHNLYKTPYANKTSDYCGISCTVPAKVQEASKKTELYVAPHLRGTGISGRDGAERSAVPPGFERYRQPTARMDDVFQHRAAERQPGVQPSAKVFQSTGGLKSRSENLSDFMEVSIGRGSRRKAR